MERWVTELNENYKESYGEKHTKTDWYNPIACCKTCDIVEKYITKGREIAGFILLKVGFVFTKLVA